MSALRKTQLTSGIESRSFERLKMKREHRINARTGVVNIQKEGGKKNSLVTFGGKTSHRKCDCRCLASLRVKPGVRRHRIVRVLEGKSLR
jgi:hypothetical protein